MRVLIVPKENRSRLLTVLFFPKEIERISILKKTRFSVLLKRLAAIVVGVIQ
jgi:hypothetical protein